MFTLFNIVRNHFTKKNKAIRIFAVMCLCVFFMVGIQMGKVLFTSALVKKLAKTDEISPAPIPIPSKEPKAVKSMPAIRPEEVVTENESPKLTNDSGWSPAVIVSLISTICQTIVGLVTALITYKIAVKK